MDYETALRARIEDVCARLRVGGHRVTSQRIAIIREVFRSTTHPTAKGIHLLLHEAFPTMSLMTVYQTLHMLQALGEVGMISADTDRVHYDGANPKPHSHLVCGRCGAVVDAPWQAPDLYGPQANGWRIDRLNLEGVGLCPDCQQKSN